MNVIVCSAVPWYRFAVFITEIIVVERYYYVLGILSVCQVGMPLFAQVHIVFALDWNSPGLTVVDVVL